MVFDKRDFSFVTHRHNSEGFQTIDVNELDSCKQI